MSHSSLTEGTIIMHGSRMFNMPMITCCKELASIQFVPSDLMPQHGDGEVVLQVVYDLYERNCFVTTKDSAPGGVRTEQVDAPFSTPVIS